MTNHPPDVDWDKLSGDSVTPDPTPVAAEEETCWSCGHDASDNWFDRSLCACDGTDWGVMHTRCCNCGAALDRCGADKRSESDD